MYIVFVLFAVTLPNKVDFALRALEWLLAGVLRANEMCLQRKVPGETPPAAFHRTNEVFRLPERHIPRVGQFARFGKLSKK